MIIGLPAGDSTLRQIVRYGVWRLFSGHIDHTFETRDVTLHYLDAGTRSAPALVFLHGGGSDLEVFFAQLPRFAANYRVVALDTRGHGESTRGHKKLSYQLYARDVAALLDHLKVRQAILIGWSDGGNTALRFALDFPARACALVLMSANFHPSGMRTQGSATTSPTAQVDHQSTVLNAARWLRQLWSRDPRSDARRAELLELWHRLPQISVAELHLIKVPALIMAGEFDLISPAHQHELAAALANSTLHIFSQTGHGVPYEAAARVNQLMDNFFAENAVVHCSE